ncbi:hypothetical protein LL273_06080 [Marinobacter salarius]|uniref:hypothetical protein n=1 Tax=Marinobacter salarius TaxID=1420917 RepID=UPI001D181227|nr:hypothetical protein [Marinobacter salarius]MCC4283285.1 hypothetical protein [Marinobacter salarius]
MSDEAAKLDFAEDYWRRFWDFRKIEAAYVSQVPYDWSHEEFALLRDAERCYASKAYYACLVLAQSVIEIHLRRIHGLKGQAAKLFQRAGIKSELDWLNKIRNDILHGNPNSIVSYGITEEEESLLEQYCKRAIHLMHGIPVSLYMEASEESE